MRPDRWRRVARGVTIAGLSTFTAALAHTIGGGAAPGALALTLSLVFSGLFAIAVAGQRTSGVRATLGAAAAQLSLHVFYSLSTPAGGLRQLDGQGYGHGHASHGMIELVPVVVGAGHSPWHYSPMMLLTHVVGVAITVFAVLRGRSALEVVASVARLAGRGLRAASGLLRPVRPRIDAISVVPSTSHRPAGSLTDILAALRYRGPPVMFPAQ